MPWTLWQVLLECLTYHCYHISIVNSSGAAFCENYTTLRYKDPKKSSIINLLYMINWQSARPIPILLPRATAQKGADLVLRSLSMAFLAYYAIEFEISLSKFNLYAIYMCVDIHISPSRCFLVLFYQFLAKHQERRRNRRIVWSNLFLFGFFFSKKLKYLRLRWCCFYGILLVDLKVYNKYK